MSQYLKELARHRDLLYMLAWRDITVKYKQSVMGFMWAIWMPLLIVSAGVLVRFAFARISKQPLLWTDIATVSVKAVPWAFCVSCMRFCTLSLVSNTNLITKIYFPRELFPLAAVISQLFDFAVATLVLALLLTLTGIGLSMQLLWIPVLLAALLCLALAIGLLTSALALFFRDVKYLVEVVLTFGIFFTPVFYDVNLLGKWAPLMLLNPVAPILQGFAACVIRHQAPDLGWLSYSVVFSALALWLSHKIFRALEPAFAEYI
jgi:lipopolysaccharide transport system permease protein